MAMAAARGPPGIFLAPVVEIQEARGLLNARVPVS
jgi:hypothetical protein